MLTLLKNETRGHLGTFSLGYVLLLLCAHLAFTKPLTANPVRYVVKYDSTAWVLSAKIANTQIGVTEATGKNDGVQVETYLRSVGLGKGYAWCAAFIVWCFEEAAKQLHQPMKFVRTALANGIYNWAKETGVKAKNQEIQQYDIVVWKYSQTAQGHTERVWKKINNLWIITDGGNTGGANPREGGGVHQQRRYVGNLGRMNLRGMVGNY